MSKQHTKTERIDVEKFKELGIIESYKSALNVTLDSATTDAADPNQAWTRIGKIGIETGILLEKRRRAGEYSRHQK